MEGGIKLPRDFDDDEDEETEQEREFEEGCYLMNPELAGTTGADREEEMENLFESLDSLGED